VGPDAAVELRVGRGAEGREVAAGGADADAGDARLRREDVGDLVAVQREFGGVWGLAGGAAPPGDVPVVEGAQRLDLVLDRGCDLARHERVAAVCADDHAALHVPLPVAVSEPGADDPAVLPQEPHDRGGLGEVDAGRTRRPAKQEVVERAAPHRQAEAGIARPLGRSLVGPGAPEPETPLPPQRRGAEREHLVQDLQPVEHGDEPLAPEEVRRDRRPGEPDALDEEHTLPVLAEDRRRRRSGDAPPDHDRVVAVIVVTHVQSDLRAHS